MNQLSVYATPKDSALTGNMYNARQVYDFNSNWRFSKGEGIENSGSATSDAHSVTYIPNNSNVAVYDNNYVEGANHETWTSVSLPHTYNDTDTFNDYVEALNLQGQPAQNGSTQSMNGERAMYGGTAWYKKTFYIPQSYSGKQVYIEFEAARQTAQIWVNGVSIDGTSLNGFIAFGYDITSALNYNAYNTITVLVDNSFPYYVTVNNNGTASDTTDDYFQSMYDVLSADGTPSTSNPIPWHDSHWHPNYGGLYRNTFLYVLNDLHLTLPLYSFMQTEGTYIYTSNENGDAKTATINVEAQIKNFNSNSKTYNFMARIFDMEGNFISRTIFSSHTLSAHSVETITTSIPLTNVKRWSPDYPYLYTVECSIWENDKVVDSNKTQIGVRTFRATSDGGFLLNENYIYLEGWGQKSTMEWAGIGSAYPNWMQEYVFTLMKDAGANYVRFGHTAGSLTQIEIANKLGIIITQPGVDGEGNTGQYRYTNTSKQIRVDAFRDMVILFRNSPSILFWELGNYGSSDLNSVYSQIRDVVNQYDHGGRGANGVVENYGTLVSSNAKDASTRLCTSRKIASQDIADLCEVGETTQGEDTNNIYIVNKPQLEGENNRYEARRGVWDRQTEGFTNFSNIYAGNNTAYQYLTSESLAVEFVKQRYSHLLNRGLNHMGGANWIFSDSISHARVLSEVCRTTGEVDATMLEKESYYVSQVLFKDEATSHIVGHWNYTDGITKTVYVVSKAKKIVLKVPDGSGGFLTYTDTSAEYGYLYKFQNIVYHPGTISVKGYDSNNVNAIELLQARASITTAGEPASIRITNNLSNPNGLLANGSDYLILDVELVDADGNRCLTYDGYTQNTSINFTLANEGITGIWRGSYNSSLQNTINQKNLYLEAGIIRVAIRTTLTTGIISLTATLGDFATTYNAISIEVPDVSANESILFNYSNIVPLTPQNLSLFTEVGYKTITPVAPLEANTVAETTTSTNLQALLCADNNYILELDSLRQGKLMYNDLNMVYNDIPAELVNAEMVVIPNNYYKKTNSNLFTFSLKQNCNLILLFPLTATIPTWVTTLGATATNYYITSHYDINDCEKNSIIYRVYEVSLTQFMAGDTATYTLGAQNRVNNLDYMYIFGFYIPSTINNTPSIDFYESFSESDSLKNYTVFDSDGTGEEITVESGVQLGGENCLKIYDKSKVSGTNYGVGGVAIPVDYNSFTFEFDFYSSGTQISNQYMKYFRMFIQSTAIYDSTDTNTDGLFRLYMDTNSNTNNSNYRHYARWGTNKAANSQLGDSTSTGGFGFTADTWRTYRISINILDRNNPNFVIEYKNGSTYTTLFQYSQLTADEKETFKNQPFFTNNSDINYILFVTGGNGLGLVGIKNIAISYQKNATPTTSYTLKVAGKKVENFNTYTNFYYMGEYDATTNPMPTSSSDFVTNAGTVSMQTLTSSKDYYLFKRVKFQITDSDEVVHSYTLSYAYYSEFISYSSLEFYDLFDLKNHQKRSVNFTSLFENNEVYTTGTKISSVPYEFSNAEFIRTEENNFSSIFSFSLRNDATLLLLVNTHDIIQNILDPDLNNNDVIAGWTYTSKIVTFDDGSVYSVFIKTLNKNVRYEFNLNDFSNYSYPPILGAKQTALIEDEIFFFESFDVVDEQTSLPYGWDATVSSGTSITYENDANGARLHFTDTSVGNYSLIEKSFSNIENTFTFSTEINLSAEGNTNAVSAQGAYFNRLWLLDGCLNSFTDYSNVGLECYLHSSAWGPSTTTYNLISRQKANGGSETNNQFILLKNIPFGKWVTLTFTIYPQSHSYSVEGKYIDNGTEITLSQQNSGTTRHFLKQETNDNYCVDKINNLVIGTSGNGKSDFQVRQLDIERIQENAVATININGNPITTFHELTKDYMYVMGPNETLPTISVASGATASATIPPVIQMDSSHLYYRISIFDASGGEHFYRVYIYADLTPLIEKLEEIENYNLIAADYTSASWEALINAKLNATFLVNGYSHNYYNINKACDDLVTAYNSLIRTYIATIILHDDANGYASFETNDIYFAKNDCVVVNISAKAGYVVLKTEVCDAQGNAVIIGRHSESSIAFTMPAKNVFVNIYFIFGRSVYGNIGETYNTFDTSSTGITITPKSTLTVEFIEKIQLNTSTALEVTLKPSDNMQTFPAGTKIIMLDLSASNSNGYYYYICTSDVSSLALTSFIKLGTNGANYVLPTVASVSLTTLNHCLVLVFDFSQANINVTSGSYGVSINYKNNSTNMFDDDLSYKFYVANDIQTNLITSLVNAPKYIYNTFLIETNIALNNANNAQIKDKDITLVVSLEDETEFPLGSEFILGTTKLKMSNDYKFAYMEILDTNTLQNLSCKLNYFNFIDTELNLKISLYSSNVAGYWKNGTLLKTQSVALTNIALVPNFAIKASMDNTYNVGNDSNQISLSLQYNSAVLTADSIEIALEQKIDGEYSLDTTLVYSVTKNLEIINFTNGVADLKTLLSGTQSNLTLNLASQNFPQSTTTYRLRLTIRQNSEIFTTLYTPIIFIKS